MERQAKQKLLRTARRSFAAAVVRSRAGILKHIELPRKRNVSVRSFIDALYSRDV